MRWKSFAIWPDGTVSDPHNMTTDEHATITAARAVAEALRRDGFGGEMVVFPLVTGIARDDVELPPRDVKLEQENKELRTMLAFANTDVGKLYADDGELQDNSARPFIDYKRDSVLAIQEKIATRIRLDFAKSQGEREDEQP